METPLLSVCLITYNHVKYIKTAIESVLMQKVRFKFELIIADDFSTDGTREILFDYQKKYPEFITLILQPQNVGASQNWINLITHPKAKYIAYFEGDDYWTDTEKLQLQVDFLEANPGYSLSFHNADVINADGKKTIRKFNHYKKDTYEGEDLLRHWLIPTASVVFRNVLEKPLPKYIQNSTHGDLALFLYLAQFGKIGCINKTMSVYRINEQSITKSRFKGIDHNEKHIEQCQEMIVFFNPRYKKILTRRISEYLCSTAYLYAREKNKEKALFCLRHAIKNSWIICLKRIKYFAGTIIILFNPFTRKQIIN
jgi:glycosyltransferase involved in cell wall biosynthesis